MKKIYTRWYFSLSFSFFFIWTGRSIMLSPLLLHFCKEYKSIRLIDPIKLIINNYKIEASPCGLGGWLSTVWTVKSVVILAWHYPFACCRRTKLCSRIGIVFGQTQIEKYLASLVNMIIKYVRIEKKHEKSYKPNQHIVQFIFGFGIQFPKQKKV